MAFSRDDNAKIQCDLNAYNNQLGYILNVPGNGLHPDFIVDPYIRLQKFGANLSANVVDINSELLGIDKQLNRGRNGVSRRDPDFNPNYKPINFPIVPFAITDQPRTTNPAWQLRDLERISWDYPLFEHQNHTEMRFVNNINSRQIEKDNFRSNCGI
jgi:hypothetical protein